MRHKEWLGCTQTKYTSEGRDTGETNRGGTGNQNCQEAQQLQKVKVTDKNKCGAPWTSQFITGLTHRENQPLMVTNLESPINLHAQRQPTETWGERANSTQEDHSPLAGSNAKPDNSAYHCFTALYKILRV